MPFLGVYFLVFPTPAPYKLSTAVGQSSGLGFSLIFWPPPSPLLLHSSLPDAPVISPYLQLALLSLPLCHQHDAPATSASLEAPDIAFRPCALLLSFSRMLPAGRRHSINSGAIVDYSSLAIYNPLKRIYNVHIFPTMAAKGQSVN